MRTLVFSAFLVLGLSGCANVSNMFSSSGPEQPFDTKVVPKTEDVLKGKPKGLVADTANAKHTGLPLQPQ